MRQKVLVWAALVLACACAWSAPEASSAISKDPPVLLKASTEKEAVLSQEPLPASPSSAPSSVPSQPSTTASQSATSLAPSQAPQPASQAADQAPKLGEAPLPSTGSASVQAQAAPAWNDQDLLRLGEESALAVFTYDHKNYKEQFAKASQYFTPEAWQLFSKALDDTKNIDAVTKDKMSVSAKVQGQSKMLKHEDLGQEQLWVMEVPLRVRYAGVKRVAEQNLNVEIALITMAKDKNPRGIAVTRFIAKAVE